MLHHVASIPPQPGFWANEQTRSKNMFVLPSIPRYLSLEFRVEPNKTEPKTVSSPRVLSLTSISHFNHDV